MSERSEICRATADAVRGAVPRLGQIAAFIGFDGFVDDICKVVNERRGADVTFIPTMAEFSEKTAKSGRRSSNYELVVGTTKLGGNGPIMADALATLGLDVTLIGAVGDPHVHPVFTDLAGRADVRGIAPPAHTDALEFDHGKLMLGKLEALAEITWEKLCQRLGIVELIRLLTRARLIATVNWTMIPGMSRIWAKLISEVLPNLPESPNGRRMLFADLADPQKRTRDDLREALTLLSQAQTLVDVTLGLNLNEAQQVAEAHGLGLPADSLTAHSPLAAAVRGGLGLTCCVVHRQAGAAAATEGEVAVFAGPFISKPTISTGAGDHFNAGFMLGRLVDLPLTQCLCAGTAASGYYVRTGRAANAAQLAEFVEDLPKPEVAE